MDVVGSSDLRIAYGYKLCVGDVSKLEHSSLLLPSGLHRAMEDYPSILVLGLMVNSFLPKRSDVQRVLIPRLALHQSACLPWR